MAANPVVLPVLVFGVGLSLFWVPLNGVRLDRINGYGLVSVLPIGSLAGAGLLVLAFALTLGLIRPYRMLLGAQVVAVLISLHGLAPALEAVARFPTAWQHAGFIDYIARHGSAGAGIDARFSWPGFFSAVGLVTRSFGITDLEPVLHWAPVVAQLLYLVPLVLILRVMRASWQAGWLAVWLFVVTDWVGQDYLSPQAFGYLLYLVFVAILLNWFRPAGTAEQGPALLRRRLAAGELPASAVSTRERGVLLGLLIAIFAVATVSHQLTPFLMLFTCTALVLAGLSTARGLPVLFAVIAVSWLSFMTTDYWSGHFNELFGGLGRLGSNIGSSVGGRVSKGSDHLALIQELRIVLAALVLGLVAVGVVRRIRRRIDDRVALILCLAPFLAIGAQSYGGEIGLRIYFFMLPGACILLAYAFFPADSRAGRRTIAALTLCGLVLVGGFIGVRFGNEEFEQVRSSDVKALDTMLRMSPGVVNFVWPSCTDQNSDELNMPDGYRQMERFQYTPVPAPTDTAGISTAIAALQRPGSFLVTTRAQEAFLQYHCGLSAAQSNGMRGLLTASPALRPVFVDHDAAVYVLRQPPPGQPQPSPRPRTTAIGATPWTPVGLIAVPLLIGVLVIRELLRLRRGDTPAHRKLGRSLTVTAVMLICVLSAVVIERFISLGG